MAIEVPEPGASVGRVPKKRSAAGTRAQTQDAGLTGKQLQAVELLAAGMGVVAAAEKVGVDRATLRRWRRTAAFDHAYLERLDEMRREFSDRILAIVLQGLDLAAEQLASKDPRLVGSILQLIPKPLVASVLAGGDASGLLSDAEIDAQIRAVSRAIHEIVPDQASRILNRAEELLAPREPGKCLPEAS